MAVTAALVALGVGFHKIELALVELSNRIAVMEEKVTNIATKLPTLGVRDELDAVSKNIALVEKVVNTVKSNQMEEYNASKNI